jgi:exosome complex RNA-binding protein Rrp4
LLLSTQCEERGCVEAGRRLHRDARHPWRFRSCATHLLPAVRDAAYEGLSQLLNGKEELDPGKRQYRPLVDDLIVGLVYDTEYSITTVNQNNLNE